MKAALIAIAAGLALPAAASDLTGEYGPLTVVVTGDQVSGTFFDGRGETDSSGVPPFTCIFFLKGKLDGAAAKVVTWVPGDPETIAGELKFEGGRVSLSLKDNPPGCAMTGDDMAREPFSDEQSNHGDGWIGVGMVSAKRAVVQPTPAASARRKPYLIQYDPVTILERQPGWVRVIYRGGGTPITGWLQQSDLASEEPPTQR